jgi:hypothetical protein
MTGFARSSAEGISYGSARRSIARPILTGLSAMMPRPTQRCGPACIDGTLWRLSEDRCRVAAAHRLRSTIRRCLSARTRTVYGRGGQSVEFEGPLARFGAQKIDFRDPDGLRIDLVAEPGLHTDSDSVGFDRILPAHEAIRGLHSVALCVEAPERTARLLTATFGYEAFGDEAGRQRFRARRGGPAAFVDLLCQPELMRGRTGAGTVHHVAFRARDNAEQLTWRDAIAALGYNERRFWTDSTSARPA